MEIIIFKIRQMSFKLTWHESKRQTTLVDRGLDFADAKVIFDGPTLEFEDERQNYGEKRMVCFGYFYGRLMVVGYVQRGDARHTYSMRKANEREQSKFRQ
jgi:uncharacterized DUF497 family protein